MNLEILLGAAAFGLTLAIARAIVALSQIL